MRVTFFLVLLVFFVLVLAPGAANGQPAVSGWSELAQRDPLRPRSVLSLVVSARDEGHLEQQLRKFSNVVKQKRVLAGTVCVVGSFSNFSSGLAPEGVTARARKALENVKRTSKADVNTLENASSVARSHLFHYLKEAGLPEYDVEPAEDVLEHLKITNSPTWVVRHLGRDYVFEGLTDPGTLFNKNGEFIWSASSGW